MGEKLDSRCGLDRAEHCPPEPLRARETIVVRGPATFTFVDEPGTRAEPVACGEHCATPEQVGTRSAARTSAETGFPAAVPGLYVRADRPRH